MKNIIRSIIVAVCLTASTFASNNVVVPTNATEAVFYAYGQNSAQQEIESIISENLLLGSAYPFRLIASINRDLSYSFGFYNRNPIAAFYFAGRADVFDQIADMMGEP